MQENKKADWGLAITGVVQDDEQVCEIGLTLIAKLKPESEALEAKILEVSKELNDMLLPHMQKSVIFHRMMVGLFAGLIGSDIFSIKTAVYIANDVKDQLENTKRLIDSEKRAKLNLINGLSSTLIR